MVLTHQIFKRGNLFTKVAPFQLQQHNKKESGNKRNEETYEIEL